MVAFHKHCDSDMDRITIYLTFLSNNGGQIKIRHEFKKDEQQAKKVVERVVKKEDVDVDAVLDDLD